MGKKTVRGHDIANRFVYSLRQIDSFLSACFVCKKYILYFRRAQYSMLLE